MLFVQIISYVVSVWFVWNFEEELESLKQNNGVDRAFYVGSAVTIVSIIMMLHDIFFVFNHSIALFGIVIVFLFVVIILCILQGHYFFILNKEITSSNLSLRRVVFMDGLKGILPTRMPERVEYDDSLLENVKRRANFYLYLSWLAIIFWIVLLLILRFWLFATDGTNL